MAPGGENMKLRERTYVIGGAHTPFIGKFHPDFVWKGHKDFGKRENPTLEDYVRRPAVLALAEAGVQARDVDAAFVGNFAGELFSSQGHLGAVLASAHPDLDGKPIARLEGACASGGLALQAGVTAIQVGAEVQTTVNAKIGADYLARAAHYRAQREIDPFTFPCLFARRTKAVREAFQVEEQDVAKVVAKAYANAGKNPYAHMRAVKMTEEQAREASDKNPLFLENAELRPYLKVSDCSQVSDGGSAVVLASERGLAKVGRRTADAALVLSCAVVTSRIEGPRDLCELSTTKAAAEKAYAWAGVRAEDVKVAEVHDCFSITEILMLEALGFAARGEGKKLVRAGETALKGRIPVNPGGGLLAFGHPVGATGVKQAYEVYRQIKGRAGDYQINPSPRVGISANMGGDDRTAVVTVYGEVA
jgi:acetyl-CoA acyltransferase